MFGLIAWCVLVRFGGVAGLVVGAVGLLICFVFDLLELWGVVIVWFWCWWFTVC